MGEGADPRCWLTLAVVLARFMILLDVTVVIVAIPQVQRNLRASYKAMQRVAVSYVFALGLSREGSDSEPPGCGTPTACLCSSASLLDGRSRSARRARKRGRARSTIRSHFRRAAWMASCPPGYRLSG
jgi:hypothetical protein